MACVSSQHLFSYQLTEKDTNKLLDIRHRTNFEEVTVDRLFDVFKKHAENGTLSCNSFLASIDDLTTVEGSQRFLFHRFYQLFDRNNDQKVDFGEFAGGLSVLCAGTAASKVQLMFTSIDADGNGFISQAELTSFFMTLLVVAKGLKDGSTLDEMQIGALEAQCKAEVSSCFEMDKNNDGKISYAEFTEGITGKGSQLQGLLDMFGAVQIEPSNRRVSKTELQENDTELDSSDPCLTQ